MASNKLEREQHRTVPCSVCDRLIDDSLARRVMSVAKELLEIEELLAARHTYRIDDLYSGYLSMGSLMSGWSSSVLSDKEVRVMRNRSLTKEEVAAFWRQQQRGRPDNKVDAAGSPVAGSPGAMEQQVPLAARRLEAIRSMPPLRPARADDLGRCSSFGGGGGGHRFSCSEPASPAPARLERCFVFPEENASAGWWTRSSWAFLNEPPKEEVLFGRAQIYFACDQFHAARIVTGNA
ncbi:hypothetical protein U9M48_011048 [Paspalum notatum var. saurae]|uniref:Uncharacterized protein n=1 Tax=Paspalum notatum var. saurae TaxID=547442 RepID=A0AAQ3SUH7_PASNO